MANKLLRYTLKILHITVFILLSMFCSILYAQQDLDEGDVVVVSVNTGDHSGFDFIPLLDLKKGTTISFTNNEWHSKSKSFRGDAATVTYTAPFDIQRGTTIHFSRENALHFNVDGRFELNSKGDNLIVFQRKDETRNFIYAIAWAEGSKWKFDENKRSDIPPGLNSDDYTLLSLNTSGNHQYFVRNGASGTRNMLLELVGNPAFWKSNPKEPFPLFGTSFTLLEPPVVLFDQVRNSIFEDEKKFKLNVAVYEHDGSPLPVKVLFNPKNSTIDSTDFKSEQSKWINFEGLTGNAIYELEFEINDDQVYQGRKIATYYLDIRIMLFYPAHSI